MAGHRHCQSAVIAATVVVFTVLCSCAAFAAAADTVPFSWSDAVDVDAAASSPTLPPDSCSCLSSTATCTEFDCTCVCDLTAGVCDPNCCCDTECTAAEIAAFTAADSCLAAGPSDSDLTFCADLSKESLFAAINPSSRMRTVKQTGAAAELMCVAVDNNPTKGDFYADTGLVSSDVIDTETASDPYSFKAAASTASTASSSTAYQVGDFVRAAVTSGSELVALGSGYMPLPGSQSGGFCSSSNFMQFMTSSTNSCGQRISNLASECTSKLSVADAVTNVRLAKAPNSVLTSSSGWISIAKGTVQYKDLSSGAVSTHPWPNDINAFTLSGCNCYHALLGVSYSLVHDNEGHLASATADIVIGNVTTSCSGSLPQSFSATWSGSGSVSTSLDAGNLVQRSKSGNPGYLPGSAVLAGSVVTTGTGAAEKAAIAQLVDGLALYGPTSSGSCSTSGAVVPVAFGQDTTFGCTLSLTQTQLESLCTSQSHLTSVGIRDSVTRLGSYGNADPLKPWDWLILEDKGTKPSASWSSSTASCVSLATSVHVEFLTALSGERGNPQSRIIAARWSYGSGTWQHTRSASSAQAFAFQTTVSFVAKTQTEAAPFVPPSPPLLQLDNDVFYPFQIGGDTSTSAAGSSTAGTAWAAAVAIMALLSALLL